MAAVCQAHDQASSNFIWESLPSNAHEPDAFQRRPWFKSMHVLFPRFAEVAGHPAVVDRVASLLGPDILAWGVTTTMRRFCRPDAEVMIPLTWDQPVQWHSSRPPCILVRGSD